MPRNLAKYPKHLAPAPELLKLWKAAGTELYPRSSQAQTAYVRRWRSFWNKVLDELRDQNTWEDRDLRLLAEFVEWTRKADFHHRMAAADPYTTHLESGRTFAHPGWKLEEAAAQQARIVAEKLLLGEIEPEPEDPEIGSPPS